MEFTDILKFEKFLSVILIKILYWVLGVVIIVLTLRGILNGTGPFSFASFSSYSSSWSFGGAIGSLVMGLVELLLLRLLCEGMIVVFSINDRLGALVDLKKTEMGK